MGSYLTIVNDTPDPWLCNVGPDVAAVKWAGISTVVLAIVAGVTTGGVAALPYTVVATALGTTYFVHHVPAASIAQHIADHPPGVVIGDSPTKIGMIISETLTNELVKRQFRLIQPHTKERYGKMTLSLWRQSDCKKISTSGKEIKLETVMMRPIYSGPTDDSNRDHSIKYWYKKKYSIDVIKVTTTPPPKSNTKRVLNEDII